MLGTFSIPMDSKFLAIQFLDCVQECIIRHTIAQILLSTFTLPGYRTIGWNLVPQSLRAVKQVGIWQWYRWCGWLLKEDRTACSAVTHAVIGRRDHPNIEPWVCDGLIQTHTLMKQHCMGGSWCALFTGYGGLKFVCLVKVRFSAYPWHVTNICFLTKQQRFRLFGRSRSLFGPGKPWLIF